MVSLKAEQHPFNCYIYSINGQITYLEHGSQVDVMYSELEKAFDKVPHERLISKLCSCGINEIVINCIRDFSTARKFRVKVNLSKSSGKLVTG